MIRRSGHPLVATIVVSLAASTVVMPPQVPPWMPPVPESSIVRGFEAPAHAYAPGHRGIDVASSARDVVAPAGGVVAFAGPVAGRTVLTLDHGDGLVSSMEPVETILRPGTAVVAGEHVGTIAPGGHVGDGTLHVGVRLYGEYINPLILLVGLVRPVLLPCC
ncbi:murein hydrolase activator EnvC [Microbacterium sp. cf332]|uniref:murein hydrolase activator EnvC family protein n=1 Tax=Microbacterium sp. cf332 TaxID=1761804 RepID=UPI00088F0086|nr:M23 family metallopeptidase [Microbacterium sp. cf332]SDQ10835.1 Peptidase family M23 [Microbacterium sp. cf332]